MARRTNDLNRRWPNGVGSVNYLRFSERSATQAAATLTPPQPKWDTRTGSWPLTAFYIWVISVPRSPVIQKMIHQNPATLASPTIIPRKNVLRC